MTLDEAIAKYKEITNTDANRPIHCMHSCEKCVQESGHLAEWLEDYKHIKQWKSDVMDDFCRYDVSSFEELVANARNKAIDDFVRLANTMPTVEEEDGEIRPMWLEEIAEQLKAGDGKKYIAHRMNKC